MAFLPIALPPGVYNNGTEYQDKNRWFLSHLVRWFEGVIRPHGGWVAHSTSAATGKARRIIAWTDNSSNPVPRAAIGTSSHLYAMVQAGTLYDITPSGFTTGADDATAGGGYGSAINYGSGSYGVPGTDTTLIQPATVWSLETYGQYLLGNTIDDGYIWEWQLNTAVIAAKASASAPTARAIVMTDERFLFVLGAAGVPKRVQWADQGSVTTWSPSATNQAGSFDLQSNGKLLQGKRVSGGTLLFTDLDVFLATYIGGALIYGFKRVAEGCGGVSQNCVGAFDGNAVWMGKNSFWIYMGFVRPLPCDVQDYVFSNINTTQISKVTVHVDSAFGEVTWHYPSAGSTENDSYVTWSYRAFENGQSVWSFGSYARTAGCDRGAFTYPLRVGTDGYVYDHEIGFVYTGANSPYAETGPIELGGGDRVALAKAMLSDEKTQGDVNVTFKTRYYPNGAETDWGPYTLTNPTVFRVSGREARIRFTGVNAVDWRIGNFRLDVQAAGMR